MNTTKIYLDYNATTPLNDDVVHSIYISLKELWANPSSGYEKGRKAKAAINEARGIVGNLINAPSDDIYFLSGGTEANTMVIESIMTDFAKWNPSNENDLQTRPHIITTSIEHPAIQLPLTEKLFGKVDITFLGWQDLLEGITENIRPSTCLVTVMLANNETGIILPVDKIGRLGT